MIRNATGHVTPAEGALKNMIDSLSVMYNFRKVDNIECKEDSNIK